MQSVNWFLICLTIFLLTKGAASLNNKFYNIIVHNLTRQVVASDGSLWETYGGEDWKMWSVHPTPAPYYYFKTAMDFYPGSFPWEARWDEDASLVLGSAKVCEPSWGDKGDYKKNTLSQQWKVGKGLRPIYNRCNPPLQLTVKKYGEKDYIYLEKPEVVNGDPNSIFIVVTTDEFKDLI